MSKPVLLTGLRPTGDLHLGHYFSLIEPITQYQNDFQIFVLIADLHAQTELRKHTQINYQLFRSQIERNTQSAINIIGQFVNVDNLVVYKQSDLMAFHYDLFYKLLMVSKHNLTFGNPVFMDAMRSEYERDIQSMKLPLNIKELLRKFINVHQEIMWGNITENMAEEVGKFMAASGVSMSRSQRDKIIKYLNTRTGVIGLATYPILMAADIILCNPTCVLVGSDQAPHLQITNDLVNIMNNTFGTKVAQVKPMIHHSKTIKGNDGRKMSKTFDNHLALKSLIDPANQEAAQSWFNKLITYPRRRNECGDPSKCLVAEYWSIFNLYEAPIVFAECECGNIDCKECKMKLCNGVKKITEEKLTLNRSINVNSVLSKGAVVARDRILSSELVQHGILDLPPTSTQAQPTLMCGVTNRN